MGLSQAQVGERLKMAHNSVSNYENGKTPLDDEMVKNFAKALEVSVDAIEITEDNFSEETIGYRTKALALDVLPTALLREIMSVLSALVPQASGKDRGRILDSLLSVSQELNQRPEN